MGTGLKIGDLEARVPVIQGGMGVGISLSPVWPAVWRPTAASALSLPPRSGGGEPDFYQNPFDANYRAMKKGTGGGQRRLPRAVS